MGLQMKIEKDNKYFKIGLTALVVICLSVLFCYLLFFGSRFKSALDLIYDIMMPVVFGAIMAYLLAPMLNLIEQKLLYPLTNWLKLKNKKSTQKSLVDRKSPYFLEIHIMKLLKCG